MKNMSTEPPSPPEHALELIEVGRVEEGGDLELKDLDELQDDDDDGNDDELTDAISTLIKPVVKAIAACRVRSRVEVIELAPKEESK
ncbi:MAG: hypothetical protein QXR33_00010 [Candidatus Nezhaarchaeales archaeon]